MAASAMVFWISRVGEHPASAATAGAAFESAHRSGSLTGSRTGVSVTLAAEPMVSDIEVRPGAATNTVGQPRPLGLGARPVAARAEPLAAGPSHANHANHLSPPRSTTSRPAPSHKSPVAPRRGHKVDPDGTLDPYQ
jgi:hypothetical protein